MNRITLLAATAIIGLGGSAFASDELRSDRMEPTATMSHDTSGAAHSNLTAAQIGTLPADATIQVRQANQLDGQPAAETELGEVKDALESNTALSQQLDERQIDLDTIVAAQVEDGNTLVIYTE